MRRVFPLLLAALLYLPASAQNTLTVDEIVAKVIETRGGMDKLAAIKTIRATYVSEQDGKPVMLVNLLKRPNKFRRDISYAGDTIIYGYDGNSAWQFDSGAKSPTSAPADVAAELKKNDIDGPLVNYKEKGNKIELIGNEKLGGKDVYNLKATLKDGHSSNIYIDAKSFIEVAEAGFRRRGGKRIDFVTLYKDCRLVQGILFPFLVEQKSSDGESGSLYLKKVEFNVPIPDFQFTSESVSAPEKRQIADFAQPWVRQAR